MRNGKRGTEVWEGVVSGNLHKNPIWPMIGEREPSVVETNLGTGHYLSRGAGGAGANKGWVTIFYAKV